MSLATDANTGGVVAAMANRYADEDARTTARLDWWVKVAGRCYGCQAHVSDEVAAAHPGVCAICARRKKLPPIPVPPEFTQHPPARPAATRLAIVPASPEEEAMPCSICQAKGHNARGHDKATAAEPDQDEAPATRAPGRKANPAEAARVVRADLSATLLAQVSASTTPGLRALRDAIDAEMKSRLAKMESEVRALREAIGEEA